MSTKFLNSPSFYWIYTTREDKSRRDKTRQCEARQDKRRHDETRNDEEKRQDKTKQYKARQDTTRHDKRIQEKDKTMHVPKRCIYASKRLKYTDVHQTHRKIGVYIWCQKIGIQKEKLDMRSASGKIHTKLCSNWYTANKIDLVKGYLSSTRKTRKCFPFIAKIIGICATNVNTFDKNQPRKTLSQSILL